MKGKNKSAEHRLNIAISRSFEKNYNWKGDEVGYRSLHFWVIKKLGRPDTCEFCGITGLRGMKIQWANVSQEYRRDITDWVRLCSTCHKFYDKFSKLKYQYRVKVLSMFNSCHLKKETN